MVFFLSGILRLNTTVAAVPQKGVHLSLYALVLCRNATVFLPHSPSTVADISSQIRNGFLQGQAAAPNAHQMER